MTTENNLCVVTGKLIVAKEVFVDGGAEKLLEPLRSALMSFVPDVSTAKGRKEIASFAAKFSKSKTLVDGIGKGLKDEYSVIIKPIDKERKIFRDGCDAMKVEARQALTTWEAEQERIAEEERQKVAFDLGHDEALGIDDLFNRERAMALKEAEMQRIEDERLEKERAEKAEKERVDNEARIKKEAEEKAVAKAKELKDNSGNARVKLLEAVNVTLDFQSCREMPEETWINFYAEKNKAFQDIAKEKWMEEQKEKQRIQSEADEKKRAEDAVIKIKNIRTDRLGRFGFSVVDNFFVVDNISVPTSCLSLDDVSFECVMDGVVKEINIERARIETIRVEKEKDEALEKQRKDQEEKEKTEAVKLENERLVAERKAKHLGHQKAVNNRVKQKLVDCGIHEDKAIDIMESILRNPIPEITINY